MTFLVVGGAGFIGLNVIEELLSSSERVIALDKSPIPPAAKKLFSKFPGKLKSIQLDITNAEDVDRVVSGGDVDVIFYGAAITAGAEREISNPLSVFDVNVLLWCADTGNTLGAANSLHHFNMTKAK